MATFKVAAYHDPMDPVPIEDTMAVGATLADMLGEANAMAYINGIPVPRAYWAQVRPKSDTTVILRAVHSGGNGSKGIIRLVAIAALTVATGGIAAGAIPALAAGSFAASAVAAGVTRTGKLGIYPTGEL